MKKEIKANSKWKDTFTKYPNNDLYKEFKEKNPEYSDIDNNRLHEIIKQFNDLLLQESIDNPEGITLPMYIAKIVLVSLNRYKHKNNFNFGLYNSTNGEKKLFTNIQTDNKLLKIAFSTDTIYKIRGHSIWCFQPADKFKDRASKAFVENYRKYVSLGKGEKMLKVFK